MGQRRSTHERPKGQLKAIRQAMRDHNLDGDQPIRELIARVEQEWMREGLGEDLIRQDHAPN